MISKISSVQMSQNNFQKNNNPAKMNSTPSFQAQILMSTKVADYGYTIGHLFDGLCAKLVSLGCDVRGAKAELNSAPNALLEVPEKFNPQAKEVYSTLQRELDRQGFSKILDIKYEEKPSKSLFA